MENQPNVNISQGLQEEQGQEGQPSQSSHTIDQENQTSSKKNASGGSYVWNFFDKVPQPGQGPNQFFRACQICKEQGKDMKNSTFKWKTGFGTGTCARHLERVHGITAVNWREGESSSKGPVQSQLGGFMSSSAGGGMPFIYNKQRMIDNMAKYVTMTEKPFTYGESEALVRFNKMSLNPGFEKVSRHTLKRRSFSQYEAQKKELQNFFSQYDGRVCLTSDCWTSKQGEPFVCVTVHWIGNDFILQKRIIAFDNMEERHTGHNIFSVIFIN